MGYDLHITRREQWSDEGEDISSEEWLDVVASDQELRLAPENGPCFALWSGPSSYADPWLDWCAGQIFSKNPDEPLIDKMVDIARILGAKVQGDDGEVYKSCKDRPRPERTSRFRSLVIGASHFLSRFLSRPKLPPPLFRVGDRVVGSGGLLATVEAINRLANYGYGEVRVKFDNGAEVTFPLFAHGLSKAEATKLTSSPATPSAMPMDPTPAEYVKPGLKVAVYAKGDRAFLPTLGLTNLGMSAETEPLVECALSVDELAAAIRAARDKGNPPMTHPSQAEWRQPTALQRRLGRPSNRKMAKMGMILSVLFWTDNAIHIAFTSSHADDVYAVDYQHDLALPLDTPDEELARHVLEEVIHRRAQPG
jgi:hypothetical protein